MNPVAFQKNEEIALCSRIATRLPEAVEKIGRESDRRVDDGMTQPSCLFCIKLNHRTVSSSLLLLSSTTLPIVQVIN